MQVHWMPTPASKPLAVKDVPAHRHSSWTITLHWMSVAAIVVAAAAALSRELVTDDKLRSALMSVHKQAGLIVLLALGLRLIVRFSVGMRDHAKDMPPAMRWAARLAHLALYVMLFSLPVLGVAVCQAHDVEVAVFGLIRLPQMVEPDPDLAETLSDWHVWAAWGLLFLVLAHLAAALWHHHVRRDGVLAAMLPLVKRR